MIHRFKRPAELRDQGAVLVFALIVVTTIALVVGVLLTRGDGSLRATVALRNVAGTSYSADAAANIAINDLRTGAGFAANPTWTKFVNGGDAYGCFGNTVGVGGSDHLELDGFYPPTGTVGRSSAYVDCAGEDGTGHTGSPVPISSLNKPGNAILTLGDPTTHTGGVLKTDDPLKVHGGVYANGDIVGQVQVDAGGLKATGTCASATADVKQCGSGVATAPDPAYTAEATSFPLVQPDGSTAGLQIPPTSCTSNGGKTLATFMPGYYDNAKTLTTATNLCNVAWFKPGNYYFDFHNETCTNVCPTNLFGSTANNVWSINGGTVIGGSPVDVDGNPLLKPPPTPTLPGSCESPITSTTAQGVQFIFGGTSRIYVDQNSNVELCGSYHADHPPIEIFGLTTGATQTLTPLTGIAGTSSPTTSGDGAWTGLSVGSLKAEDGSVATWASTGANKSNILTIKGFQPGASSVPVGSILAGATLHIRHADGSSGIAGSVKFTAKDPSSAATSTTAPIPVPASASATTKDIPIPAGTVFNYLQKQVYAGTYSDSTVDYTAKMSATGSETLDAITLELSYYPPYMRGQTDAGVGTCVLSSGTSCPFLDMKNGNNKILFYLQGTTYVPAAYVQVLLGNFAAEVAKFGIIVRQLHFAITNGNPSWTGPIFEIPDNSPGYGYESTVVDLRVHVCLGEATVSSACKTNIPAVTSRVQVWDPDEDLTKRQISVLSWSHSN